MAATLNTTATEPEIRLRDEIRFWIQRVLVPMVTVAGVLGNTLTVVVMCQRRMRSATTHIYLATLALYDAFYLVFAFLLSLNHYPSMASNWKPWWTTAYRYCYPFLIFCCDLAYNTSIWLTVLFTFERFMAIRYPLKARILCTRCRTLRMIALVAMVCTVATLPTYFEYDTTNVSKLGEDPIYRSIYNRFTALAFTIIPLTMLTVLNSFLIHAVRIQSRKRKRWIRQVTVSSFRYGSTTTTTNSGIGSSGANAVPALPTAPGAIPLSSMAAATANKYLRRHMHTYAQDKHITRLLIAMVVFFILCQLPAALLLIYISTCHAITPLLQTLGNLFNFLVAINSAGNFVLYCLLSRRYRQTVSHLSSLLLTGRHCCGGGRPGSADSAPRQRPSWFASAYRCKCPPKQ